MPRRATTPYLCALGLLVLLTLITWSSVSDAEVSARTNRFGQYVAMQVIPVSTEGDTCIWRKRFRGARRAVALNPSGDANGDLYPAAVESPVRPYYPWVVWSRFNGTDYDLAFSSWSGRQWRAIESVSPRTTNGDDLDPQLGFDSSGRAYLVWWREVDGMGQVFVSAFINERWQDAYPISDPNVDARYPTLEVGQGLRIEYETPSGIVQQFVAIGAEPTTITDDIDPQGIFVLKGEPRLVQD